MPGPGTYESTVYSEVSNPKTIPRAERNTADFQSITPGPAGYNLNSVKQGPQWGFGSSARIPKSKTTDNRAYSIPASFPVAPPYLVKESKQKKLRKSK